MREDRRISSQPEVEFEERDVIIPWPIVTTVVLFVAFAFCEALFIGRGPTPLDGPFDSGRLTSADIDVLNRNYVHLLFLHLLLRGLDGMAPMISISGILLALAMADNRSSAVLQLVLGPVMGTTAKRKGLLIQGEILAAVTLAIFLCRFLSSYAQRPGDQAIPEPYAVAAVAFWGSLAQIAWAARWRVFWRYTLTGAFLIILSFVVYALLAFHVYVTTIGVSFLLGAAMLCAARWCIYRYA